MVGMEVSVYDQLIREALAARGLVLGEVPVHHVEAWMRVNHATLDGLSPAEFQAEAWAALDCALEAGPAMSELLAASFAIPDRRAEVAALTDMSDTDHAEDCDGCCSEFEAGHGCNVDRKVRT